LVAHDIDPVWAAGQGMTAVAALANGWEIDELPDTDTWRNIYQQADSIVESRAHAAARANMWEDSRPKPVGATSDAPSEVHERDFRKLRTLAIRPAPLAATPAVTNEAAPAEQRARDAAAKAVMNILRKFESHNSKLEDTSESSRIAIVCPFVEYIPNSRAAAQPG
jgi:hypothetical protein